MKVALAFLIVAGALCVSGEPQHEGSTLAHRFFEYLKDVDSVMALWETFIKTPPSNEQKRQEALANFLAEHNRTLTLQFDWFTSVLVGDISNPHLSLQQSLLLAHRSNMTAAAAALEAALETYRRATVLQVNVLYITNAENNAIENLQIKAESTLKIAEENAKIVVEKYKNGGWKKHLDQDIMKLVKQKPASKKLLKAILDFLKVSYPFRHWLVVNYRSGADYPNRMCIEARPFVHRYYHNDARTELIVVHAPLQRRFGSSSEANLRLSRLTASDWHWRRCHKKAGDIYGELKYSCGSNRHSAVMVLPEDPNEITLFSTNDAFVHRRTVKRHFPVLCKQFYSALIFG